MADSDKDILITPNTGESAKPKIEVTGADNATKTITINDDGTLSFDSTIAATTGSVADGNANLVTGDAVFDYIAAQNFVTSGASNFVVGDITGQTALTSGLASTDELVLSDAGVLKRMDVSVLQSYMQSNLTFTTDTILTTENVQDIIGAMVDGGTETNIAVTYDDTGGKLNFISTDTNTQLTTEQVQDIVGAMLVGTETRIGVTYDDTNGRINFVVDDMTANTQLTLLDEDNFATNSATAAASQQSIKAYVDGEVAGLVDSSPSALNTLNELAAALGDDASFSTTTATSLGNRLRVDVSNQGLTSTQQGNALTNLGITASLAEINILDDGLAASDIPNLAASKITSGTLGTARIPNLATSKITSGTFADGRIASSNVTQHQGDITSLGTLTSLTVDNISVNGATIGHTDDTDLMTLADGTLTVAGTIAVSGDNKSITFDGGTKLIGDHSSDGFQIRTQDTDPILFKTGGNNIRMDVNNSGLRIGSGARVTTILDEDNMASDSATALATQQSIKAYVDSEVGSGGSVRTVTAGGNTLATSETLAFTAGTNIAISESGGAVTIASAAGNVQLANSIALAGETGNSLRITTAQAASNGAILSFVGSDNNSIGNLTVPSGNGTISTSDTQLTTEQVQDIVGGMFGSNTETRISATYQDGDGTIDLVVDDMTANDNTQLSTEQVQDIVGGMLVGTETRIGVTYDDTNGRINFVVDDMTANDNTFRTITAGGNTLGSTETLAFTAGSNVTITESNGAVTIASTDTNTNTQLSTEQVQDIVGGMLVGTETRIGVSYDDTNGRINFVVDDMTANTQLTLLDQDNMSSNSATAAASQQSIKAYVDAEVAGIVDSAPSALNTLNELAAALGDDASFSTTTATSLGNRLRIDVSNQGLNSTQQGNALTNLGITASLAEINILDDGLAASDIPNLGTSKITSGTFADARIAESNVTQHLAAGTGLDLSGKTFSVDMSELIDNSGNNRILTAKSASGTDINAETTFTYDGTNLKLASATPRIYLSDTDNSSGSNDGNSLLLTKSGSISYLYDRQANSKLYLGAADDSDIMIIDGANARVGIGTTSPSTELDVDGTVTATAFAGALTGNVTGNVSGTAATVTGAAQTAITSLGTLTALTGGTGDLIWDTDTFVVDSSEDRVGIGTTSPAYNLDVASSSTPSILIRNTDAAHVADDKIGSLLFFNAEDSSGQTGSRVGAGLRFVATDAYGRGRLELTAGTSNPMSSYNDTEVYTDDSIARLSILTDGGNIGIGTTSPAFPLDVNGFISTSSGIVHTGDTNNTITFGTDTQSFNTGSTARMNISDSGLQVGTGARVTTINTSFSDNDTSLMTSQAIKEKIENYGYITSQMTFILEDDDGTEVSISNAEEIKFLSHDGSMTIDWTDIDNGSDSDPFDVDFRTAHAPYLRTSDDRDFAPEDLANTIREISGRFSTKTGLEDGSTTNASDYVDALVLDTFTGHTGGDANLLAFSKTGTKRIYHYRADQDDTNWGTASTIAYTSDVPTTEAIQDIVGAMFSSNTETNITATYQDDDGTIDLVGVAGDITAVTAGTGLTGGGSSGAVTVNVIGGTGITANANDIAITAAQTGITSVFNTGLAIGYASNGASIDFGTDNQITFAIDGTQQINLFDGGLIPETHNDVDLGNNSKMFKDAHFRGTLEANAITIQGVAVTAGGGSGDITAVVAGNGLTGGATSGSATLNIGAGTGIDVAADAISVDVSDFMTNGSNNRIVTATGTDAMNAESGLTWDGSTLIVNGGTGDAVLSLRADSDNSGERDQPYMEFVLDGTTIHSSIGHSSDVFHNDSTDNNTLIIANSVATNASGSGIVLKTGTSAGHENAVEALRVNPDRKITFNSAYTFPLNDGSNGQVLTTNGSGSLTFADAGGGSSTTGSFYLIAEESNWQLNVGVSNGFHWSFGNGSDIGDAPSTNAKNEGIALPVDCTLKFLHLNCANDGSESAGASATVQIYKATSATATQSAVSGTAITATVATNGHGVSATGDYDVDFNKGDVIVFRSTTANQSGIYVGRGTVSAYFVER